MSRFFLRFFREKKNQFFIVCHANPLIKLFFFSSMHCKEEYFCALQAVFQFLLKLFMNNNNQILLGFLVHTCVCLYMLYTLIHTMDGCKQEFSRLSNT